MQWKALHRRALKRYDRIDRIPDRKIRIEAHTDSTASEVYNEGLSDRRADSVLRYLEAKGIDRERMTPKGFGETQPVGDNRTREGRAQNRRVEIHPE